MEDSALLRPPSGPGLLFTVDFITPVVDEPERFGAIAAANSLSDVYAAGGEPQVALAICGFPEEKVSRELLERIFRGGRDKAAEAGCAIVGGHTVIDPELKYGLCVLGSVDPARALSHRGGGPGDRLVLTKPLGFGVASQALKQGRLAAAEIETLCRLMETLNRGARDAALGAGVRAATDVTGFGLLGHLHHLALGAGCAARVFSGAVPVLDWVRPLAGQGCLPGGTRRNREYVEKHARFDPALDEPTRWLLCDAQTSGGLLLAVPRDSAARLLAGLEARGTPARAVVGELVAGEPGQLEVLR
jgi:selenide,water dikinase